MRTAVQALQLYAERIRSDDQELATVHTCITNLQKILAQRASDREAALGVTPAMRHVARAIGGC